MSIPITQGSGQTSIASEKVGTDDYQKIEVYGGGGASVLSVNPDGSLQASIVGVPTVKVQSSVAVVIVGGSIAASFTPPANQSVSGTVQTDVRGSVATVIIGGSIAASFTPPANQSVSGAVTAPPGSVMTVNQLAGSVLAISGTFNAAANQSVSGAVTAPAGSVMTVAMLAGSITGVRTDSASVIVAFQNSSIVAVPVGSVITIFGQGPSVVGTYAEDAAHTSGDKGLFALQVRNDTLASITSADGDYSPLVVGPMGEAITANSPITKWISGTASALGGVPMTTSVTVIAAQGSSIFTYVTGVQVANFSASSVLVSFFGGTNSLLGYTIAPAGGGSNINYPNGLKTNANSAFAASVSGAASIYVAAQGFISKT